jgi:hypothetical protein
VSTTSDTASGGEARPGAAVVHRRVDTEAFEQHVANLLRSIELAPGVKLWATVRLDDEGARLDVRAATAAGDVTASRQFDLPKAVRDALEEVVEDAEEGLRAELKQSIARTLAAAALGVGQES